MKIVPALWLLLTLPAASISAQSVQPAATPDPNVVKITTSIIQIDVSVTDRRGNVISDLKPEEIEIYENGQKQTITNFTFVSNVRPETAEQRKKSDPKSNIPEPPLVLRPEQVRRTIALVVDDLTLSFESAAHVRRALKRFVDTQMQDGDLVGIIRTGAGIGALQQFTSDKAQLYAAVERVKWNSAGRGRFGSFSPAEPTGTEGNRARGDIFTEDADIRAEKDFLAGMDDFQESVFTTGTLGALKYIVGGMGELPGRKSVILFSDGFQIFSSGPGARAVSGSLQNDPAQTGPSGSFAASRTLDFLRELIDIANRKAVVFYTIDARGLQDTGATAADTFADPTMLDQNALQNVQQLSSERSNELFNTQQGLVYLAKETGGFPYINQNDIGHGIQRVLNDQSYYLVAYEPDADTFDPEKQKFNKLEVKVVRDGLRVRHRSGFFVESDVDKPIRVDVNTPTKIMRALTSPFAVNGVTLRLNALFGHSQKRGYFVHSFLHVNGKDLTFAKQPNGDYQAQFDVLAISYGDNGVPVDKNNVTGTINVKAEHYEKLLVEGFSYSFIFPVKKPGAYQMRVALFDRASKEVGSANQFVEVPNLKKHGIALSGIVLENRSEQEWAALAAGQSTGSAGPNRPDPLQDTSLRRFKRGTVLRFGTEVYNAKAAALVQDKIKFQARVFHDRKLVFEGRETPFSALGTGPSDPVFTDAVELGKLLLPGDYVLQVVVTDGTAKEKRRIATQYVQFEVIE